MTFKFESVYDDTNKNTIKGEKPIHYFSVYIVKKILPSELLKVITTTNLMNDEAGKHFVREVFKAASGEPNVGIPEMKIINKCSISSQVIKYPGRVISSH